MAYKIGVIGDKDSILPFKLFGFDVRFSTTSEKTAQLLKEMVEKKYGIIYLTEEEAQKVPQLLTNYQTLMTPAIILIPSHKGSLGIGQRQVNENVEKAVGQNILKPKE